MKFSEFVTKEMIDGFGKWFKICCYCLALIWLVDLVSKLPNELSEPIVNILMSRLK